MWLEGWITLSAVASQMGLFTAELSSDTYLVLGLAEKGMLPKFLAHKSKYGTPTIALLLSCSGVIVMLISFNFINTVEMLNVVYCFSELLEFSALVKLRMTLPDYPRPFKIPLNVRAMTLMLVPSSLFAVGIILAPFVTLDYLVMLFTIICWALSITTYYALEYTRSHNILKFNEMQLVYSSASYERLNNEDPVVCESSSLELESSPDVL